MKRKQRKWLILLPLIILMKIAHLKMTLVGLILGVLALNILIVGGGGWLIHYLKFKTLCKIHPQLVHHHSHAYDSDPAGKESIDNFGLLFLYHIFLSDICRLFPICGQLFPGLLLQLQLFIWIQSSRS